LFANSSDDKFIEIIDGLILRADKDIKFKDAIRRIDIQSQKEGLSFYEIIFTLMQKDLTEARARQWLKNEKFNQP
jgi:hypothetical protein